MARCGRWRSGPGYIAASRDAAAGLAATPLVVGGITVSVVNKRKERQRIEAYLAARGA